MNRDDALKKIKKCLALSRSANEHEAAAALRQAQALMRDLAAAGPPTMIFLDAAQREPAGSRLIGELEPFDRQLFGGIVGWCEDEGNGEWVVTIRCARLQQRTLRLFAGAGIVPASSPLGEWRETGVKLTTMLNVFGLQ